ncbi:hypothetical protein VP01_2340g3, partial [Puccinia sorghi]
MLDNDIEGIFELIFSIEADDFGSTRIVDLNPGGQDIPVTKENKAEYVQLLVQNRLKVSIREQIDAFKKGFDEIIPQDLVRIFSATELQLLLNGLPEINVKDCRANTELHQFQQKERTKLLQFTTSSSIVPLEVFGALQGAQGATKVSSFSMLDCLISRVWAIYTDFVFFLSCSFCCISSSECKLFAENQCRLNSQCDRYDEQIIGSHPSEEDLELVFKICTNVLRCQQCGCHNSLADIRVLLILTQKHSVAKAFLNSGACPMLPCYFVIPLNQTRSNKQSWPKRLLTSFPLMAVPNNPIYLLFANICFPWPGNIGQPGWRQSLQLANLFPTMALRGGSWLIALDNKKDQKTQESKKESDNSILKISSGETASSEMQIDEIVPTDPEKYSDDAPWRPTAGKDFPAPNAVADPTTSPNLPGIADAGSTGPSSSATTSNLVSCALGVRGGL